MTETATPSAGELEELFHLDLTGEGKEDPVKEVQEKPEKAKACGLLTAHPHDPDLYVCGRPAYVQITIDQACCQMKSTLYVCKGHWTEVEATPDKTWRHTRCGTRYPVKKNLLRWERV